MVTNSLMKQAYELTAEEAKETFDRQIKVLLLFQREMKSQIVLASLDYHLAQLDALDPVLFPYLTEEKKQRHIRTLQVTLLLLFTQRYYESYYQKNANQADYNQAILTCYEYIDRLQDQSPIVAIPTSQEQPVAYLYLKAGYLFAQSMAELTNARSITAIQNNMSWFNQGRLCWVWDSSFLKSILALLPPDFFNTQQATKIIYLPDPYTGTLSWGLYYFRFAINLGLLLKHTLSGPWMSEELKAIPWPERFMMQWEQRKFILLNDLIWATGNLACFFWLCGSKGTWGDILTIALLTFDLAVAFWDYEEQCTAQRRQEQAYLEDIKHLEEQIKTLQEQFRQTQQKDEEQQKLAELQWQLDALKLARNDCIKQWETKKLLLATNTAYAAGLVVSFVLLTAPYFPLAANTLISLTLVGAALCFAITLINNAIKGHIELDVQHGNLKALKKERSDQIIALQQLIAEAGDDSSKKLLFLEIKKNQLNTYYQQAELTRQQLHLARSIIIESLIPPVVLLSLVFLPTGMGIGIIAIATLISATSYFLIDALFKEDKQTLPPFDEQEYQNFLKKSEALFTPIAPSVTPFCFSKNNAITQKVLPHCTDEPHSLLNKKAD